MLNQATLIGHLGGDPEIRRTQDGRPIANFSLATSESWRDKATGERKERTEWHRIVIFNEGLAKVAEQYLKKGSKVYIAGKIQTRKWTDQAGVEKYTTEIVLNGFESKLVMLNTASGNRPPASDDPNAYGTGDKQDFGSQARRPAVAGGGRGDMDDEIPF